MLTPDEKKKAMRRFTWCRIDHDLLNEKLWRLVARMSGAPLPFVKLFVIELEVYASANERRGSVEGFSIPALAADWSLPGDEQLGRIYAALEHPEVGWLDQDFIVTFWKRNPDAERDERQRELDKARQQRARDRRKAEKEAVRAAREARGAGYPQSRVTRRDAVTVTPISDQIINQNSEQKEEKGGNQEAASHAVATGLFNRNSGNSGDGKDDSEIWLAFHGKRIVVERMGVHTTRAQTFMNEWRKALDDEAVVLAEIIRAAALTEHKGARFHVMITDQIGRWRREQRPGPSPSLPLMPPRPAKRSDRA
jgi:hypothetical protein